MGGPRYVWFIWLIAATKTNLQPSTINPTCARLPTVQYPSLSR